VRSWPGENVDRATTTAPTARRTRTATVAQTSERSRSDRPGRYKRLGPILVRVSLHIARIRSKLGKLLWPGVEVAATLGTIAVAGQMTPALPPHHHPVIVPKQPGLWRVLGDDRPEMEIRIERVSNASYAVTGAGSSIGVVGTVTEIGSAMPITPKGGAPREGTGGFLGTANELGQATPIIPRGGASPGGSGQ
jgi:hypothetical protein